MKKRFAMIAVAALAVGLLGGQAAQATHDGGCGGTYTAYVAIEPGAGPLTYCSDGTLDGINDTAGEEVVPASDSDDVAHGCAEGKPVQVEIDLDFVEDGLSWCLPV